MSASYKVSFNNFTKEVGVRRFNLDKDVSTKFINLQEKLRTMFSDLKRYNFNLVCENAYGDAVTDASDEDLIVI